jgi:hypothetical protein
MKSEKLTRTDRIKIQNNYIESAVRCFHTSYLAERISGHSHNAALALAGEYAQEIQHEIHETIKGLAGNFSEDDQIRLSDDFMIHLEGDSNE